MKGRQDSGKSRSEQPGETFQQQKIGCDAEVRARLICLAITMNDIRYVGGGCCIVPGLLRLTDKVVKSICGLFI